MTDKLDVELFGLADKLTGDKTKWIKDNIIPSKQDFSFLMAVARDDGPTVWVFHSDGTDEKANKEVTVIDEPGSRLRRSLLRK